MNKFLFMNKFLSATAIAVLITSFAAQEAAAEHSGKNIPTEVENMDLSLDSEYTIEETYDPYEPFNRGMFAFNSVVDDVLLEPIATGYTKIMPEWGQKRVHNFLSNLNEPVNLVNNTLQGKDQGAFTSLWRFIINSTFGLLGTFDAATEVGLKPKHEGFGQTLHAWGYENSPYLVLPFIGPSTTRDAFGFGVDIASNPFNYGKYTDRDFRIGVGIGQVVDTRASLLPVTQKLDSAALDPYVTYRSSYLQNFEKRAKE